MPEPSRADKTGGELDWPDHVPRTPREDRERTAKFSVPLGKTFDALAAELDRIGAVDHRLSTAAPHRDRDGRPYANASPDDAGVVLRWTMPDPDRDDDRMADFVAACDRYHGYEALRDNARELLLWLREKRKMDGRPVRTGRSAFANARLPPGDEEAAIVADAPAMDDERAAALLGVSPGAPDELVKKAFRVAAKDAHPDAGDNGGATGTASVDALKRAREQLLGEE